MLSKLQDLPSGIVHLIYALIALPLLFYLANKVTIIAEDAAARNEASKAQAERINHLEFEYNQKIQKLEREIDYLTKRLIDKTSTIILPYKSMKTWEYSQETSSPEVWLPVMPVILNIDRRKLRVL